jgi:hypothetical protein
LTSGNLFIPPHQEQHHQVIIREQNLGALTSFVLQEIFLSLLSIKYNKNININDAKIINYNC